MSDSKNASEPGPQSGLPANKTEQSLPATPQDHDKTAPPPSAIPNLPAFAGEIRELMSIQSGPPVDPFVEKIDS